MDTDDDNIPGPKPSSLLLLVLKATGCSHRTPRRKRRMRTTRTEGRKKRPIPIPGWAVRLIPGCIIDCSSEATNADAVEGAARVVDAIIKTHMKA